MKAEDLMIGDLFQDKYSKQIIKVLEIKKIGVLFSGNFVGKWQAEPIPLTEESIVELLGFEKCGKLGYFSNGHFDVSLKLEEIYFRDCIYIPLPKHVHKLQQLIKSLQE